MKGLKSCFHYIGLLMGWLCLIFGLLGPVALAQPLQDLKNPRQHHASWINDQAGLLSSAVERRLNRRLDQLVAKTTAELAIVTVPELLTSQSPHAFALELFNTWKIGQRHHNNGVLLFVTRNDRRLEIITGRGLGTILPDLEVGKVVRETIVPAFQQGDYEAGMVQGVATIADLLERRLPSALLPTMAPIILAGLGGICVIIGYGVRFFWRPRPVPIPVQGFQPLTGLDWRLSSLSAYSLPQLLDKLFAPDRGNAQVPWLSLGFIWSGGSLLGLGLATGFLAMFLPSPDWNTWQIASLSWFVNLLALNLSILFATGLLLPYGLSEFCKTGLLPLALPVLLTAPFSLYLMQEVPSWQVLFTVFLLINPCSIGFWYLFTSHDLRVRSPWCYVSESSQQSVVELAVAELENLLTPAEVLAVSMENLQFRGWRDATVTSPFSREQVYLVEQKSQTAIACQQCQSLTVEKSTRPVEKTIQTWKKVKGQKKKQAINSVIQVQQTIYTCHACGYVQTFEPPVAFSYDSEEQGNTADYTPTLDTASASESSSSHYDYPTFNDDNTSSGGFGGGSSDGGGFGSDW